MVPSVIKEHSLHLFLLQRKARGVLKGGAGGGGGFCGVWP